MTNIIFLQIFMFKAKWSVIKCAFSLSGLTSTWLSHIATPETNISVNIAPKVSHGGQIFSGTKWSTASTVVSLAKTATKYSPIPATCNVTSGPIMSEPGAMLALNVARHLQLARAWSSTRGIITGSGSNPEAWCQFEFHLSECLRKANKKQSEAE